MAMILNQYKAELSQLIAKGHAKFGRVAPRKPYRDDDDGDGAPGLTIETHPLLSNMPEGASSDLTAVITDNSEANEAALERAEELTNELKNQPALQAQLANRSTPRLTPKPY